MSTTTALVKHGTTDLAEVRKARAQLQAESESRRNYLKLAVGKNVIRILPPWAPDRRLPFYEAWVHYLRNPAEPNASGKPVLCPAKMKRSPVCVVCAKVHELYRTNSKADEDTAKDMRSGRRVYANVVNMQEPDKGVQVMEFGTKLYDDITALMAGQDEDDPSALGDISNPDTGYLIVIERVGTGKNDTKYSVRPARASSAIAKREWLTQLHDLSKIVEEREPEYVKAIMEGRVPDAQQGAAAPGAAPQGAAFDDDLFEASK